MKLFQNPDRPVELERILFREFPAPPVINNHYSSDLGSLNNSLYFATIPTAFPVAFGEQEIHCSRFILVATLEKIVGIKERIQPVLPTLSSGQLIANRFWHQHM